MRAPPDLDAWRAWTPARHFCIPRATWEMKEHTDCQPSGPWASELRKWLNNE